MIKRLLTVFISISAVILFVGCTVSTVGYVVSDVPPAVVMSDDPDLIVITGTYVYYAEGYDGDLFFTSGYWWRPWRHAWYRAEVYSGPWITIEERRIPYVIIHLPPRWREMRNDSPRVRWGEVRYSWQGWERDKYWDKHQWKREEIKNNDREVKKEEREKADRKDNPAVERPKINEKNRQKNNKPNDNEKERNRNDSKDKRRRGR